MTKDSQQRQDGLRTGLAHWFFSPLAGVLLGDWLRLWGQYALSIPPQYWGRVAFTTGISCVNSLVALRERAKYAQQLTQLQPKPPVFILGHHRSGTTHLWRLLSNDPQFAYPTVLQTIFPHTFLSMEKALWKWAERLAPRKRPQDNVGLKPDSPIEEEKALCTLTFMSMQMARHFPHQTEDFKRFLTLRDLTPDERAQWIEALQTFSKKLLLRYGADKTLIYKAPSHTAKIRILLEAYPDARFIHIHRDPYRVYLSTRNMELKSAPMFGYQKVNPQQLDDFILWRYRAMYDAYFEDVSLIPPGRFSEVSYDELVAEPKATLQRIYNEISLPGFSEMQPHLDTYLQKVSGYRTNTYPNLPADTRRQVAERWQPSFEHWGYAL